MGKTDAKPGDPIPGTIMSIGASPVARGMIWVASGYSMDETDTRVMGRPTVAFLQKPYTYVSLSKVVRESLDKPLNGL